MLFTVFIFTMMVNSYAQTSFLKDDILCLDNDPISIGEFSILKNDTFSKKNFKIELNLNKLPQHGVATIKRTPPNMLPTFFGKLYFDTLTIKYKYFASEFKRDSVEYIITDYDQGGKKDSAWLVFDVGCKSKADPNLINCEKDKIVSTDPNTCKYTYVVKEPTYNSTYTNTASFGPYIGTQLSLDTGVYDRISIFAANFTNNIIDECETYLEVKDLEKPKITCPSDIFSCDSLINFQNAMASDNCFYVTLTQTEGLRSGSIFPKGTTKITFKATDANNQFQTCSFNVRVANLPEIDWINTNTKDTLCTSDANLDLKPQLNLPVMGTWSSNTPNGIVNPSILTPKDYQISFSVKDSTCNSTIFRNVTIEEAPVLDISPIQEEICTFSREINLAEYNKKNIMGDWYLDNQKITPILKPSNIENGFHTISFKTKNIKCPSYFSQNININNGRQLENNTLENCGKELILTVDFKIDTLISKTENFNYTLSNNILTFSSNNFTAKSISFAEFDGHACKVIENYTVTFYEPPSSAYAGENIDLNLQEQTVILAANQPTSGKGKWHYDSTFIQINNKNLANAQLNITQEAKTILIWETYNGVCESSFDTLLLTKTILKIPNAFSPNGDSKNDYFILKGLDNQNSISIRILNRWGQIVYSNHHYLNDWDGTDEDGNDLPEDVYFYDFSLDNSEVQRGKITLKR